MIYRSHELPAFRVNRMIHYPTDNNGLLLRGSDETLWTQDNAACVSLVSNVTRTFTYEIHA